MSVVRLDQVGCWSEIKLEIIRKYAAAYSSIMSKQLGIKRHLYIDGFAGAGTHVSKKSGQFVQGSPAIALEIMPPFSEYHFIDLHSGKAEALRTLAKNRANVHVYQGDCNQLLLQEVLPRTHYEDRSRGLCLLDPYGLHLNWEVLQAAGQMKTIEIFLNFPIMDINMNVLLHDRTKVSEEQKARMDAFWGDRSWEYVAYEKSPGLFETMEEKTSNSALASAFCERLKSVAGFKYVAKPMPMRNEKSATVYYLVFASPNKIGAKIVGEILDKYRNYGIQ
jgi:three-Cys-motif partner protein